MPSQNASTTGNEVIAIASHTVADYATWRAIYDAGKDLRGRLGVRNAEVFVDPREPDRVLVVTRYDSLADMEAFNASPELAASMKQAGVGTRTILVGVKA